MKILVTGTAGFIGFHLVKHLRALDHEVVGIDSINEYYDVRLKHDRLRETGIDIRAAAWGRMVTSTTDGRYRFCRLDLTTRETLYEIFETERFDVICHLAAQAGVRHSLEHPGATLRPRGLLPHRVHELGTSQSAVHA